MNLRRELGFWSAVGRLRFATLARAEFVGAIGLGIFGGLKLTGLTSLRTRVAVVGDFLPMGAALLAIVFAAFSLVVSLMNDDHLRRLRQAEGGLRAFLSPFIVSIGAFTALIIGAVSYRAAASLVSAAVERWLFVSLCFLFVFTALDLLALSRNVFAHAILREKAQEFGELPRIGTTRQAEDGG